MVPEKFRSVEEEAAFQLRRTQLLSWKAGMEEMNRITLEEARLRTPAERFRNHQRFLEGDARFGLAREKPEHRLHKTPYHEIQELWLARHPECLVGH